MFKCDKNLTVSSVYKSNLVFTLVSFFFLLLVLSVASSEWSESCFCHAASCCRVSFQSSMSFSCLGTCCLRLEWCAVKQEDTGLFLQNLTFELRNRNCSSSLYGSTASSSSQRCADRRTRTADGSLFTDQRAWQEGSVCFAGFHSGAGVCVSLAIYIISISVAHNISDITSLNRNVLFCSNYFRRHRAEQAAYNGKLKCNSLREKLQSNH